MYRSVLLVFRCVAAIGLLVPAELLVAAPVANDDPAAAVLSSAASPSAPGEKQSSGSPTAPGRTASAAAPEMVVDITLERKHDGKIEAMAAGHVFAAGDIIRLKVLSHYDGYLYVMDQGTSGKFSTVFPAIQTGSDNRVHALKQYLVPAVEDGWFEVNGPAGFDVLYFLLSPAPLATPVLSSFAAPGPVSSLKPRCNDDIFRARGECTDDSAGPAALPTGQELPAPLAPLAGGASRDITFTNKANGTVGVQGESTAPMLYTFRLAHL